MKKIIRPTLKDAGIIGKVAQEFLRYANGRATMDIHIYAVSAEERNASGRPIEMLMGWVMQ